MKKDKANFINMSHMSNHYDVVVDGDENVNSNATAATNDTDYKKAESQVSIPKDAGVEDAKDWVDNGSKL
ncbi:MAG: CDIF630_02480 family spore surface protein [Cellulosilyticaceae bacterium]